MVFLLFLATGTAMVVDSPKDFKYSNKSNLTKEYCKNETSKGMAERFSIQETCY